MTDAISPLSVPLGSPANVQLKRGNRWFIPLTDSERQALGISPSSTTCSEPSDTRPSVAMDEMDEAKEQAMAMATRIRDCENGQLAFWCPACNHAHVVKIAPGSWTFNGDYLRPTINPSILVQGKYWRGSDSDDPLDQRHWPEVYCHSFVREGQIVYCEDSKHKLAGQTVPIPCFP